MKSKQAVKSERGGRLRRALLGCNIHCSLNRRVLSFVARNLWMTLVTVPAPLALVRLDADGHALPNSMEEVDQALAAVSKDDVTKALLKAGMAKHEILAFWTALDTEDSLSLR